MKLENGYGPANGSVHGGAILNRCGAWFLMGQHKQQCGKSGQTHDKHELFMEMPDGNVFRFEWEIVDKKKLTRL